MKPFKFTKKEDAQIKGKAKQVLIAKNLMKRRTNSTDEFSLMAFKPASNFENLIADESGDGNEKLEEIDEDIYDQDNLWQEITKFTLINI